ncbi:hypothetical protein [Parabacteroides leei]|uniref:hypothetical protein n=1 Tax=Parabacteroides leei TaxID=2939491 RepID=UPI00189ACEB7|nr:hypothetical protein [Parabacteroides goldsteinii]
MKKRHITLPSLPGNWKALTLDQFKKIEAIRGKFASSDAYLTHCFIILTGLRPLRYAERWRLLLGLIPILSRFIKETGRLVIDHEQDYLGLEKPVLIYAQYYCFSGIKNLLFGKRFIIQDQEILSFQQNIKFLADKSSIQLTSNPVKEKIINNKVYFCHQALLSDMTWHDYNRCSMFIELYLNSKNVNYLEQFIAVLYKMDDPSIVHGNFSELEINLILLYWNDSQKYFKKSFPHMFKEGKKQLNKDYMKNEAELTVFLGKEAYTRPEDIRKMRAYDALQYLEMNAIICEEKERQIKKMKTK